MTQRKYSNIPLISIGLPVYNGEKFIRKRLENILSQSFPDFELIISDNASIDSTSEICKEFEKKDTRIRYISQEKNMGGYLNFDFVLKEAKYDYFVWAAVDDLWDPQFLEKNLNVLESNKNFVASISRVKRINSKYDNFLHKENPFYIKYFKTIKKKFASPFDLKTSLIGDLSKKSREYLRNRSGLALFCLFRTDALKKSVVLSDFLSIYEPSIIFRILKLGDINVIDDVLFFWYPHGISTSGRIGLYLKNENMSIFDIIFPEFKFTFWCFKNIGIHFFLKNLDFFTKLYIQSSIGVFQEFTTLIRLSFKKNKN